MQVLSMAWRNVWRNGRRSVVTMLAMCFALVMMILYSGIVSGYLAGMQRNMLDVELGYLQVFAPDYQKDPSLYERIEDGDALVARLQQAGFGAAGRLRAAGLVAAHETSAGVSVRGVNVQHDRTASSVYRYVAKGKWLDPSEGHDVVLGRKLAISLGVQIGDEVVLVSQAADGSMANDLYRVRGVLKGISDEVDRGGLFMTEAAFREIFVVPSGVHQILVRKPSEMPLDQAEAQVERMAPGLDVETWKELMPTLASMLQSTESMIYFMFIIVYIAVGIILLNAMLMAVFERIREFGVLKAIGFSPYRVLSMVLLESAVLTVVATVLGLLICWPAGHYLTVHGIDLSSIASNLSAMGIAWDPVMRAKFTVSSFTGPIVTLYVIVFLAVLYPAIKAATIAPVEAMHHT